MKRSAKKNYAIVRYLLISYIFLGVMPILLVIASYGRVFSAITSQITYSNQLVLNHVMQLMDNSIQQLNDFSELLNNTASLDAALLSDSPKEMELSSLTRISAELPRFYDANSLVNGYYIYGIKNHTMWSRNQIYYEPSMYYGYGLKYDDIKYDAWRNMVEGDNNFSAGVYPAVPVTINGQESLRLMYTHPFYNKSGSVILGRIIYFLDVRSVMEIFRGAFDMGASSICILDEKGVPLLETASDIGHTVKAYHENPGIHEIETEDGVMLMTNAVSDRYGWNYAIFIPKTVITQRAQALLQTTLYIISTVIALTMVSIMIGYYTNATPLLSVARKLNISHSANDKYRNGLWQIEEAVNSLITDRSALQMLLEKQKEQLDDALMLRLINGDIISEKEVRTLLKSRGVQPHASMRGVYMRFPDMWEGKKKADDNVKREIASKYIQGAGRKLTPLMYVSESDMALLLADDEENDIKEQLIDLAQIISQKCGSEAAFAVGHPVTGISELGKSFARARLLFADRVDNNSCSVLIEDGADIDKYDYSHSDQELLMMLAREGNAGRLDAFLMRIYERNFIKRTLTRSMRLMLEYRLVDTLLMIDPHVMNDQQLAELMELLLESFYETLRVLFKDYCEGVTSRQTEERLMIAGEIPQYIEENLYDPELSLAALSVRFNLTESYLSVLIKQLLNENFSSYLECRRMHRAAEMLEAENISVSEIAAAVGYLNANSFSRAFKRAMGVSPTEYVRLHKEKRKHI